MEEITEAIADLDEIKVLKLVKEKVDANEAPIKILEACRKDMAKIGSESGEGGTKFLLLMELVYDVLFSYFFFRFFFFFQFEYSLS